MKNRKALGLRLVLALAMPVFPAAMTTLLPTASQAAGATLPAPYVSRALDAVLLPIDADVRSAFGLGKKEQGVLVLAVQPGGVAAANGIEAGDVIAKVRGRRVKSPLDVDAVVYYWLQQGTTDFVFGGYRGGSFYAVPGSITMTQYTEVIDIATVETWTSWSSESFSYSEYYSSYSSEISESYEASETLIEETATSEDYAAEVSAETDTETMYDEGAAEDASAMDDGSAADDGTAADDGAAADDAGMADDSAACDPAAPDGSADCPVADEPADDAPDMSDDAGGDDGGDMGGDDGGDAGGDDGGGDDGGDVQE